MSNWGRSDAARNGPAGVGAKVAAELGGAAAAVCGELRRPWGTVAHRSMFTRTGGGPLRRFLIKTDGGLL